MAAKNETWLIVLIVIVAGVLIALSFTRNRSDKQAQVPVTIAADAGNVQNIKNIKPDHSSADMQKISGAKLVPAIVEMPKTVVSRDAFAVQVFSFKEKGRADAALKLLKDKGYTAYIMMSDLGPRGIFYRVRVGSFASEAEAKKNLGTISKDFNSGIIVSE